VSESALAPSWLPNQEILIAQLASGLLEYTGGLPYPANLQLALNRLTLLAWHQDVTPPDSAVGLLQWASEPFGDWPVALADADVDMDESLIAYGRPTATCEELGYLRGDVEGEMRENALMHAVMDKTRAAGAPESYVAFRRLLIEHPAITELDLDAYRARGDLALLAEDIRQAYTPVPPEAVADGIVRTCAGCQGLRVPLDDDRTWVCEDDSCPAPHRPGPDHPAAEGVSRLRRELRTFITAPGRAELRIAKAAQAMGAPVALWPDFDAYDLAVFEDRPWVVDVKAWRNPVRLGRSLRGRLFTVPPEAERAFIVIAKEQARAQERYMERLRHACPELRRGRIAAVTESQFLAQVRRRMETTS